MKVILNIIKFIVIIALTVCCIILTVANTASSTILSKQYTLKKLEETGFYHGIYTQINSNFENYIYQSGLDEDILVGICSEEKVKKDLNTIISNIYDGTQETIDAKEIETNLNNKIDALGVKNKNNEQAIEKFVQTIGNEYKESILHTKYEGTINSYVEKAQKLIGISKNISAVGIIVGLIILIIVNIKNILSFINQLGITFLAYGSFILITINAITSKIKIENIKILNDTFSNTVVNICTDIINNISKLSIFALILGIITVVICGVIKSIKTKEEKEI